MTRLIYRYTSDSQLVIRRVLDESSTHYYWINYSEEIERCAKSEWSEVPDSAYVDVSDACEFTNLGLIAPSCSHNSTRVVKKRDKVGNAHFVVEQLDVDKLPKRKS